MKKEIKKLELNKLFKEFSFLKLDEEYKSEIQAAYGPEFTMAVQELFKKNPDLDLLYNTKPQNKVNVSSETNTPQTNQTQAIDIMSFPGPFDISQSDSIVLYKPTKEKAINKEPEVSGEIKKLYRKIATKTHPDKVSNKFLNDTYLKAKTAYQSNDLFAMYLLCSEIGIDFEFPKEELNNFKTHIKDIKNRNNFIEQTFLWAWAHEENEDIRRNILIQFLIQRQKIMI